MGKLETMKNAHRASKLFIYTFILISVLLWTAAPAAAAAGAADEPAADAALFAPVDADASDPAQAAKIKLPDEIKSVVPLGNTTGIRLQADGVVIVGLTNVVNGESSVSPSRDAGLLQGDVIVSIGEVKITSSAQLQETVAASEGRPISITVLRGGANVTVSVTPAKSEADGQYRIGVWVRDNMMGIGTLTFYEPKSGLFGALGHGISDMESGNLLPMAGGQLMPSTVSGVKQGQPGVPGELQGSFNLDKNCGRVLTNTNAGIYGLLTDKNVYKGKKAVPVARASEVCVGAAEILSNIHGDSVEKYSIQICKLYPDDGKTHRNMLIEVTDERLISETGGIVQGMSGSPILQNGRLIGAVTHVLVNDPKKGYGIFIENMLDTLYTLDECETFAPLVCA